jgi:ribosome-associated heat shock protein Hsp15
VNEGAARIDVWLWRARFFKTRGAAARAVEDGRARLARDGASRTLAKPSAHVRPGDGLTLRLNGALRCVMILALGERRGPAREAQSLYAEVDPATSATLDEPGLEGQTSRLAEED